MELFESVLYILKFFNFDLKKNILIMICFNFNLKKYILILISLLKDIEFLR